MTWQVYQHWDPLKICVVGRSYPPEFYNWIKISSVRNLFEKIAVETEEDYQCIIKKLQQFHVQVLRPELPKITYKDGKYLSPPMTPRDTMCMIGDKFYARDGYDFNLVSFYNNVKDPTWPHCESYQDYLSLPKKIHEECESIHRLHDHIIENKAHPYKKIFEILSEQKNQIIYTSEQYSSGSMVSRIGKDLYFGTSRYDVDIEDFKKRINQEFTNTRNHVVNTGGHADGTYCPVCPGLIISLRDVTNYAETYPGWEVIYLPNQSWSEIRPFLDLKEKNNGKWWIPGFEYDTQVIEFIETWLSHWTGYVAETVFDVNMLIIDPKNVMLFNHNQTVFDALDRYGITAHVVPFRHRRFWDGGIHCVTLDLHRDGFMQDFFPERG